MEVSLSPVKEAATRLNLPVIQPDKIKHNDEVRSQLEGIRPDAIIVVGYGRIIPQWMIELPRLGNLNLHASLLPKYRGAAPIQWAIARGELLTGVTTMKIDEGLDTGDILLQRELAITPDDTAEALAPKLAAIGADLMVDTLRGLESGQILPSPQDDSKATLALILTKEDGRIDFHRTAADVSNRLRGFQPWPGAHTLFRGRHIQVHRAHPAEQPPRLAPGELTVETTRLLAGCGNGTVLELVELQPEGKRRMSARDFTNGYQPKRGEKLGQ
jgi:methionyl-tRNA formyltransferase